MQFQKEQKINDLQEAERAFKFFERARQSKLSLVMKNLMNGRLASSRPSG